MKIQSVFSTIAHGFFAISFSLFFLSSCGSESQPAEQIPPAETEEAAQSAAPDTTEMAAAPSFDFEHFGSFDLTTWKQMPASTEEGGDVEIKTTIYEKDGIKLEIAVVNMGEYGFATRHTLKGTNGQVQKIRVLEFTNEPFAVTETVQDYTVAPAKKYSRTQKTGKHYSQLDPLPTAATGTWKEGVADKL